MVGVELRGKGRGSNTDHSVQPKQKKARLLPPNIRESRQKLKLIFFLNCLNLSDKMGTNIVIIDKNDVRSTAQVS
jgi:hypothetical protein